MELILGLLILTTFTNESPQIESTPLRMPMMLMTTPTHTFVLENPIDTYEELFISYPFINDSNYLILQDGVPVASIKSICFPAIEKIEVMDENVSSIYGNYDGVINIITKRFKTDSPYSSVKLAKNPDYCQFELGRIVTNGVNPMLDIYMAGNLDTSLKIVSNIGYKYRWLNLRTFYNDKFILQGDLFSHSNFIFSKDFYSFTQQVKFHTHNIVLGIEDEVGGFVQEYWEPFPLVYIAPSVRYGYDSEIYPKLAMGYIPLFNTTIFGSITKEEKNIGFRVFESSVNYSTVNGIRTRLISPVIYNFKLGASFGKELSDLPSDSASGGLVWTCWGEYSKDFPAADIGVHLIEDLRTRMIRAELRIIDIRFFYKWKDYDISYGLFWDFWD